MKSVTVWTAFYDVLRAYNMTTIFGNPGSTGELP
jgi:thiamine pyrophosphate-dependent acetolactate synthase large subunit-like protein